MAKDASQQTGRGTGGSSWLPVGVAILAVAAFIGWLATRQPPETVAVDEPGESSQVQEQEGPIEATTVDAGQLVQSASARNLMGQTIELPSVRVQETLGSQAFWIELPGGSAYLVRMDTSVTRRTPRPGRGEDVRVIGQVEELTPARLDEWLSAGAVTQDERNMAEFGPTTYIEAQRVQRAGAAGARQ
jgi:hypothetical protein